ncbi:hypothetical protein C9374_000684 [Naegleria lovaniensis]|uniref:RGS domain-containing protein n=1 Tax=Naegleria lovaniensis TaxID=51637 RepID=A0AA88GTD6_NAELO|nr:uncharacterized protein C9374_000684 [Naegleria lovaniensis]KAG2388520.1 hypothetical protein C9374_000684 [Naegleria lovaniensis]
MVSTSTSFNNKKRLIVQQDLSQFDIHFEAIFDYAPALECFTRYLHETMNTESSDFLSSVNEFRKMKHERKRLQLAMKMYEKFIADQASSQLNLRRDVRMKIHNVLFPNQAVPLYSHSSSLDHSPTMNIPSTSNGQPVTCPTNVEIGHTLPSGEDHPTPQQQPNVSTTSTLLQSNPTTTDVTTPTTSNGSPITPLPVQTRMNNQDPATCPSRRASMDSTSSSASSYTNSSSIGGGYSKQQQQQSHSNTETTTSPSNLGNHPACPKTLFDEVESHVLLQLKQNHFVSFIESEFFLQFLQKQPLQVLYEIGSIREGSVLQLADSLCETLRIENVTCQDFKFVKNQLVSNLAQDWELIGSNAHYKCYLSTKTYDMGESQGLHFFKFHVTFPYHVLQVMSTMFEMEYKKKIETHLTHTERVAYLEKNFENSNSSSAMKGTRSSSTSSMASNNSSNSQTNQTAHSHASELLMASVLVYEKYKLVWPLSDRDFVTTQSGAFDANSNTYFWIMKGLSECARVKKEEKNVIRGLSFGGCSFRELTPNSTEYSQLFYMDLKGRIPKSVIKGMIKDRAKEFTKIGTKLLQHNETMGFKVRDDNMVWKTFEENGTLHL